MKKIKRIAIVTTRQNYKWTSMQEVLPGIEKCWETASDDLGIEHRIINVDVEPLREYVKFILQCDMFIIIAFNETISRFMKEVRTTLNIPAPFVLHLYGHATLGLWPQYRFGALDIMNSGDIFIGTCPGDIKCMQLTCLNARTYDIPYPHFPLDLPSTKGNKVFAYVGRISDQKNVDLLIEAYALLKERIKNIPKLIIYGKEDHFGSPNMGIASTNCLEDLKVLADSLGVSDDVVFRGFVSREAIYSELGKNHIFLSASTHSDENFGMALLRSLAFGGAAVVSNWGGHQVFKAQCPERVWTVAIEFRNSHPRPIVSDFAIAMEKALDFVEKNKIEAELPSYFSSNSVTLSFKEIIKRASYNDAPLIITDTAQKMFQQQKFFESQGDIQRVFYSYSDPFAQLFLKAYL